MLKKEFKDSDYQKVFRLWKAEEYFNPIDYPELRRVVKMNTIVIGKLQLSITTVPVYKKKYTGRYSKSKYGDKCLYLRLFGVAFYANYYV